MKKVLVFCAVLLLVGTGYAVTDAMRVGELAGQKPQAPTGAVPSNPRTPRPGDELQQATCRKALMLTYHEGLELGQMAFAERLTPMTDGSFNIQERYPSVVVCTLPPTGDSGR
jgi:hypothetical protein